MQFKIKKAKHLKKKKKNDELFTNPIYADLDAQDSENENKHNLGPWVRETLRVVESIP